MRTLHEIMSSELELSHPIHAAADCLDDDFDTFDFDCLVENVNASEGE